MVGGNPGTMFVRVVRNDQGSPLPPDLVDAAPSFPPRAEAGELVTLIGMDHFVEGNFDADPAWVVARACEMHDHIIETFHGHVVTEGAVEGTPRARSWSSRWTGGTRGMRFWCLPRIVSSSGIDRGEVGGFGVETRAIGALPIARQVRELQAALSVNESELARILRVSRPTVYDWLDGDEPTAR